MEENRPTTERTKKISEDLKALSKSLKEESKETEDPSQAKELEQLARILKVASASTKTRYGISLFSLLADMYISREMMLSLREKEEKGELPINIEDMLGLDDDEDDDL